MTRKSQVDPMTLALDSYMLWAESMTVIGMRTADMLTGHGSERENVLMVTEKVLAASDLGWKLATGGVFAPEKVAHQAVKHYRSRVRANRRRLARRKRTP